MAIADKLNGIIDALSGGSTNASGMTIEEKLNVIQDLVKTETTPFVVKISTSEGTSTVDKTWEDILDAFKSGHIPIIMNDDENDDTTGIITSAYVNTSTYYITHTLSEHAFSCSDVDEYPSYTPGTPQSTAET